MNEPPSSPSDALSRWQQEVEWAWDALPEERRRDLMRVLGLLPKDVKGWRELIDRVVEHVHFAAGDKRQIAVVGPANVGKSTLYNRLIRSSGDRAEVGPVPGTTRRSQQADAGLFVIVDTPGADAPGAVGEQERERAIASAQAADLLIVLFDAAHGIRGPEQRLFAELKALGKPLVVALNKIDLVGKQRAEVLGKAAAALGLQSDALIPLVALKGQGIERLLQAVAWSEPAIVGALGSALPEYRWSLSRAVIARGASTAAAIALTPLPFLDFFPLVGVQAAMVLGIARIYAYQITPARARELIATFGLAMLGRTLFYELSKLSGPPGWLISAGVAAGTTVAIGYASAAWFDRGERLSAEALQRISKAIGETIIDRLRGMGRRKPGRGTLRSKVRQVLEDLDAPAVEEAQPESRRAQVE